MSNLKLNGHPIEGTAILETSTAGGQRIHVAITVPPNSPVHQLARAAVLANQLEVTLEGEALKPDDGTYIAFKAVGQFVNGRVGSSIHADFKTTRVIAPSRHLDRQPE